MSILISELHDKASNFVAQGMLLVLWNDRGKDVGCIKVVVIDIADEEDPARLWNSLWRIWRPHGCNVTTRTRSWELVGKTAEEYFETKERS